MSQPFLTYLDYFSGMSNNRRLRRSMAQAGNGGDQRPGAHHYRGQAAFTGRENVYTCEDCRGWIVTIDRDPGVTPMFLGCRVPQPTTSEPPCQGRMVSAGYPKGPKPPQYGPATWEWFRPDTVKGMEPAMARHIMDGGLELRPIK